MSLPCLLALILALSPSAQAEDVQLTTSDGVQLHAVYEPVQGTTRGVLLVHGERRTANDWKFLAAKINHAGFSTLAVNLRGHGESTSAAPPPLGDENYQAMVADVQAGLQWLRDHGTDDISLVGADVGANLALAAGSAVTDTSNIVLLSPGLKIHGIRADVALKAWDERPVLFVVSTGDHYSAKSALLLDAQARGP